MFEMLALITLLLYGLLSAKVDEWITISVLGFRSETPRLFLESPKSYDIARSVLFIITLVSSFGMTSVPWYVGLATLVIVWLLAGSVGRKKAYSNYRNILREMIPLADTPEQRKQYEDGAVLSDRELMEIVRQRM